MDSLVKDPQYFPQVAVSTPVNVDWIAGITHSNVQQAVNALLGDCYGHTSASDKHVDQNDDLALFKVLNDVLPTMSSRTRRLWMRVARPFAQMLHISQMSLSTQCTFLVFLYARVFGFLGPEKGSDPPACLTLDGSPIEFSWIIPNKKVAKGKPNRNLRCVMEPFDPRGSGSPLRGSSVLKYFSSYAGSLGGVVRCDWDGLLWVESTEGFFFPQELKSDYVQDGGRFAMGFDFTHSGIITLKAYFLSFEHPPWVGSPETFKTKSPLCIGDTELSPLRDFAGQIHPSFAKSCDMIIDHMHSLETKERPVYEFASMDCKSPGSNRLKLYTRSLARTNFSAIKEDFTLGGRIHTPELEGALLVLEKLWNSVFPDFSSAIDKPLEVADTGEDDNGHPQGGLPYHYEFAIGDAMLYPKVYIPVRFYSTNDLETSRRIEKFYDSVGIEGPEGGEQGPGWVEREVAKCFEHRTDLDKRTGCRTYLSFGLRKGGWEVTSYFSPELFSSGHTEIELRA
ncbi:aromatic prenyltransferase [Stereum hirsutum FP-91666 SS1]|uniref:aromatic prenyltransferase n=1 Tax=Stereum hirsutum (strain FP-91666) TaxID=721885 RepID=UPI0004449412|nr:aromatic prenyltransferase [Stereum hirsutum FP-91666 SS1]EIM81858.1 aromatic prenyltransferase [Stereum hirsutum FP-91666 SS1]